MARHPADIMATLTVRVPRGHQGFWQVIRDLHRRKKKWTLLDVDGACNVAKKTVHDYLQRLCKGGFVERTGITGNTPVYRLVKDQPTAPRLRRDGSPCRDTGRGQDQMWRTMKMTPRFDARELAVHATTEEVPVSLEAAKSYISRLKSAGYLQELLPGKPGRRGQRGTGGRLAVYRLLPAMNTGPLAPQIQATDFVWDPNTEKVMDKVTVARGLK